MNEETTISDELLTAYLNQQVSTEDRAKVEAWMNSNAENGRHFAKLEQAWKHAAAIEDFEAIDVEARWNQMQPLLDKTPKGKQVQFLPKVWRYAATLVLLAVAAFLVSRLNQSATMLEVVAEAGNRQVMLPDGSEVWLNKGAKLQYPERFSSDQRLVTLAGEAFFEVTHNPEQPFLVSADGTETRVLGTSFNIKEEEGEALELVLVTGKVRFTKEEHIETLAPGDVVRVGEDGEVTKTRNADLNFMSWKTRTLQFDNTPMRKVIEDVEKLYGVTIQIEQESMKTCPLTTTFQDESLEDIFETIKILFDAQIEQSDQGYIIRGNGC